MTEQSRIVKERLEKIACLQKEGRKLYGSRFPVSDSIKDIINNFEEHKKVRIAGRVMAHRGHGKSIFADVKDASGKVQIYFKIDIVGEEQFHFFQKVDIGDIIGIEGELFKSRTGEITVKVDSFRLLSKIVQTLPEKWHGLRDTEIRYRQRYLDIIANEESRDIFIKRSQIITSIRSFLVKKGFMEVETPILQPIPGGAKAEPFCTHHRALHTDLYLRVAPELYLKKLLVGGFDKVFEIGRNFRNEGISIRHNPEFTMLELYQSYADYTDMMDITEELITGLVEDLYGGNEIPYGDKVISFKRPWKRMSYYEALKMKKGVDFRHKKASDIMRADKSVADKIDKNFEEADFLELAFDEYVLPELNNPTFITDYPVFMTPLAKRKEDDSELVYRFELFISGMELANAYSELNDPFDQRERFYAQKELLNKEQVDEDFLTALEYAMPPAGGLGIGIDRLVMLLTNAHSIRDVILFPQLRPERKESEAEAH